MLSPEELENVKALLLSPDSSNVALAVALLQEQPEAVESLLLPLEIALTYSTPKQEIVDLLQQYDSLTPWRTLLPLYAFYNTIAEPQALEEHQTIIRRFVQQEPSYRPYLLADNKKAILYVDGATFIAPVAEFVDDAHAFYTLALAHLPADSYLYYNYADLLRKHPPSIPTYPNNQHNITSYYRRAYFIKKERHILSRLADYYTQDLKDLDAARHTWQWCLREDPHYGAAWVTLAKLEVEEEQWSVAQELLQEALNLKELGVWVEIDQVYHLLGLIAWRGEEDLPRASQYFEKALEENKYFAAPLEALLQVLIETKDYQKAIRWHRVALELQPMNLFLLLKLALLYFKTENYDKAADTYREILESHPNYGPALEGLAQLEGL